MATPNIVPRSDSEGGLGTASKYWASAYIDAITTTGNVTVGGVLQVEASSSPNFQLHRSGTGQLWNFSVDSSGRIQLKEAASLGGTKNLRLQIDDDGQVDITSGALTISSDGANAATLTESASGDFTIASIDDLRLESGGNDIVLRGASSVEYGRLSNSSGDFVIQNMTADKDIIFKADNGSGTATAYLTLDGELVYTVASKPIKFLDNISAAFGTTGSGDYGIVHDGSHAKHENYTGDIKFINYTNEGDIIFYSDDGGTGTTEYFRVDGGEGRVVHTANSRYLDNATVMIGSSADLQIKHDGSHSYISQGGTGNLYIQQNVNSADLMFQCDDGNDNTTTYFYLDGSSATHDGSATTALYTNWPDKSIISLGTSHDLQIHHNGTDSFIANLTGDLAISNSQDGGDIRFQTDNGSGGVTTYLTLDGSDGRIKIPDSKIMQFGAGGDLQLQHNATNSSINNYTGNLEIVNNADDADVIFQASTGTAAAAEYLRLDGGLGYSVASKHILFGDGVKARFGNSADLEIFHDGSHSYITDQGTGHLQLLSSQLQINNAGNTENMITAAENGSVTLFNDGSAKLATTSTGISVTGVIGTAEGSGIDATDAVSIQVGEINGEIITTIFVDIGAGSIQSSSTNFGALGNATDANAYITQVTTAINGIVYKAELICVEVPTVSSGALNLDIDLTANASGTIASGSAVSGTPVCESGGSATLGRLVKSTAAITPDHYLYLAQSGTNAGVYNAGKFLIRLYGAKTTGL